jgi:hypothetical protein
MRKFTAWLAKVVEESPGVPSTIRVIYLIVTLMVAVVPILIWAYLSIHVGAMVDFPSGAITLFGLLFGVVTTGKVFQQRSE